MNSNSDNSNSWTEVQLTGVPPGYIVAYPAIDQDSDKVFFEQGYTENDHLVMKVFVGLMAGRIAVRDGKERVWTTDARKVFGETNINIHFTEDNNPGERDRLPGLGLGIINGSDLYIPYCLGGFTFDRKGAAIARGPYNNGVFHSSDFGMTWQMEQIYDTDAALPSVCRTKEHCYYFAASLPPEGGDSFDLWFARKRLNRNSWDTHKVVAKTFCRSALSWKYVVETQNDTVHLCWLDNRHEKRRFNLVNPQRENYEIVYCNRKDSDADWSTDAILSKGMLYSYSPTMSVEGDNVVVAWAGVPTAPDWHSENSPNDIFYRTSKDGGKTWGKLFRVTDNAKDGITSGEPQVALQSGIIHLFYIQGKRNLKEESPGLTKLNQPPWPIYYRQRLFPN